MFEHLKTGLPKWVLQESGPTNRIQRMLCIMVPLASSSGFKLLGNLPSASDPDGTKNSNTVEGTLR